MRNARRKDTKDKSIHYMPRHYLSVICHIRPLLLLPLPLLLDISFVLTVP